jgi:hypothetical protein
VFVRSAAARRVVWFLAIVIGFVGLVVSFHLVGEHFRFSTAGAEDDTGLLEQACTAFATSDCGKVIKQSRWGVFPPRELDENGKIKQPKEGEPDPRIPTAELGMYYWTALLIWLLVIGIPTADRAWVQAIFFVFTCLGLGFCAFLAYIMFFGKDLDAWCPLCALTHLCGLLMVILAVMMWPRGALAAVATGNPGPESPATLNPKDSDSLFAPSPRSGNTSGKPSPATSRAAGSWPPTYLLGMVVFMIVIALFGERSYSVAKKQHLRIEQSKRYIDYYKVYFDEFQRNPIWHGYAAWLNYPPVRIDLEGDPMRGDENAEHTMVVFSDFQCPACRRFELLLEQALRPAFDQLGGVKIYFKNWPICTDCNPYASNNLHPVACQAARAATAAMMLGGNDAFWRMHDLLFDKQDEWKESKDFAPYAREVGLDVEAFKGAMASDEAERRILNDIEDSKKVAGSLNESFIKKYGKGWVEVNSTPSVYLDGRVVTPSQQKEVWVLVMRAIYAEQQKRAAQGRPQTRPETSGPQDSGDPSGVDSERESDATVHDDADTDGLE